MTAHMLENPIWHSLCTEQTKFSLGGAFAKRYPADVAPFVAFDQPTDESLAALSLLIPAGEMVYLLGNTTLSLPGFRVEASGSVTQMVWHQETAPVKEAGTIEVLSAADAPEMIALTALAFPGYFRARTYELGRYYGIRVEGSLMAMAGERMSLPGYQEVSAVCTHPALRGRGYAQQLVQRVVMGIRQNGITPFLHVGAENEPAKQVYEKLGFKARCNLPLLRVSQESGK